MLKPIEPFGVELLDPERILGDQLFRLLRIHSLLIIRQRRLLNVEELRTFALSIPGSTLLQWDSGDTIEMKPDPNPKNYLFSRERVPFHWDGAFHQVPDFLVFYCLEAPLSDHGGETLFANTRKILNSLSKEERQELKRISVTYRTEKRSHYGGEFTSLLIDQHPLFGRKTLRFAEEVRTTLNPVTRTFFGTKREEELSSRLTSLLYNPKYCYSHGWQVGDIIVADNHTLLHGRKAFSEVTKRHLRRVQVVIH